MNTALHQEIADLRAERDYWKAAHDELHRAFRGTAMTFKTAFRLSPMESSVLAVLMSGRTYSLNDLARLCLTDDVLPDSIQVYIYKIRRKMPWIKIISKSWAGYRLEPESITRIKDMLNLLNQKVPS